MDAVLLPTPPADRDGAVAWVERHLVGLFSGPAAGSSRFRGGQGAADAALTAFDVQGYAATRSEVWPEEHRGASGLSPYIRHGLLPLRRVWNAVADGPGKDVRKFRDELLWQEYARHLYARLGRELARPLRYSAPPLRPGADPWDTEMACVTNATSELADAGWLVNQSRMWLSSHWTVRSGRDWRIGEDRFFRQLLDGSRAANRLGWQWTSGLATGRPYGFARTQVERRAPGLCATCPLADDCPIEQWPEDPGMSAITPDPRLGADPDLAATRGPRHVVEVGTPDGVWLTAESLGDSDPALAAHPELPAVFVFDASLLRTLQLSAPRLVFLTETLGDLAARRHVDVIVGAPSAALKGRAVAATYAPVPGWTRRAAEIEIVETHPWPWLVAPHTRSVGSFSAWRKHIVEPKEGR